MLLSMAPSTFCSHTYVAVPKRLRIKYNIDVGDVLVFHTKRGHKALIVTKAFYQDIAEYGDDVVYVHEDLLSRRNEVEIRRHALTIGGDPELFLVHKKTGAVVEAYRYLAFNAPIGSDGQLAELRPRYGKSPEELVENIRPMVNRLTHVLPRHIGVHSSSWYQGRSCGFHVHLGLPEEILLLPTKESYNIMSNIVVMLDYYVGILAAILEDSDRRRLSKIGYGKPGDFRVSVRTLEYRTIGGFFLSSPEFAHLIYKACYDIVDRALSDMSKDSENWLYLNRIASHGYLIDKYAIPEKERVHELYRLSREKLLCAMQDIVASSPIDVRGLLNIPVDHRPFPRSWHGEESKTKVR